MVDVLCFGLDTAWTTHLFRALLYSLLVTTEPVTCSDCSRSSHTVFPSALLNSLQVSPFCLTPLLNHTAALGILLLGLDALPAQTWLRHRAFPHPLPFHQGTWYCYLYTWYVAPQECLLTSQCVLTSLVILVTVIDSLLYSVDNGPLCFTSGEMFLPLFCSLLYLGTNTACLTGQTREGEGFWMNIDKDCKSNFYWKLTLFQMLF